MGPLLMKSEPESEVGGGFAVKGIWVPDTLPGDFFTKKFLAAPRQRTELESVNIIIY